MSNPCMLMISRMKKKNEFPGFFSTKLFFLTLSSLFLSLAMHQSEVKPLSGPHEGITGFEKINFKNYQVKYQKTLVTKVLNVSEHSPQNFWWSYDEN